MTMSTEPVHETGSIQVRRALISVSDKTGLIELASTLQKLSVEIISTGGTARALRDANIPVVDVADITGFPEMLDGRVKTLHPRIHAGILAKRHDPEHQQKLREFGISFIDLVIINLYPFEATVARADTSFEEAIEQIDIGGPSLIRAAAKNFEDVAIVTDPADYATIGAELQHGEGCLSRSRRLQLATTAFARVACYDALIAAYLKRQCGETDDPALPDRLDLHLVKLQQLRYGENPHQRAALYGNALTREPSVAGAQQLQGKELSFNNLMDLNAAFTLAREFDDPAVVIVKHTNPCGVGIGSRLCEAYQRALAADPTSAFGGVLSLNRPVDGDTARELTATFAEAVVAPGYHEAALAILREKKALRLLQIEPWPATTSPDRAALELRPIVGGMLVQERDQIDCYPDTLRVVTRREPTDAEMRALRFAWKVAKHVKSNAIVLSHDCATVGIGAGQMSRVDACRLAIMKAVSSTKGTVLASDAFFPFRDGVDVAAEAGVTAIIQPGGSIRDAEVIQAADEADIAMVFTGIRHFRH
ncbi:MAG: bifunctional phosphoribosylaminoimidazolecarboxamide formyltransferase/IMP cyclohydrolase [bacterium]|uniref:Bifunctional purine biosynthesis protein PurH n=1 Tax=Candidatus Methylomirabilis tolerans TaxID=3123416 RepID=A0AAJ1AI09_9BACT|nr:bifunctional phosphoribosylaminoimidazolecarboxamide formyltransferase/IMP cyclohydrolase [Candidatus Methylomirabilis sp.]